MRTKLLLSILALSGSYIISNAQITVTLPESCDQQSVAYYYAPIKKYANAKTRSERGIVTDSVKFENSKAVIPIPTGADSYMFGINLNDNNVSVYAVPGEKIEINVMSCNPFNYTMTGSALVDGMTQLKALESPILDKANALQASGEGNSEEMQKLFREYTDLQKKFINDNPGSPAAPLALMNLEGEDFIKTYEALQSQMSNSILYPLATSQYEREKRNQELEQKQQALQTGDVEAPNFTLKDLDGKDVSLSDFRGKWVILDFWGSWCPWCIKGFPELKDIYKEYSDNLTIIGIDCNESEADWRTGVEKYSLPWVNVYNPAGTTLLSDYGVQGFPTKVIISPDGVIKNITVGHNPEFSKTLASLINQ